MRIQFILSEVMISLRRNIAMAVSLILVTLVSMFLFGAGLLMQKQVGFLKDYWYDRVQVSIFMCNKADLAVSCSGGTATKTQKDQVMADLQSPQLAQYVDEVYFEDKEEAFEHFKEQLEDSVLADNLTAEQMPESYRVKLKDPKMYTQVAQTFRNRPGVSDVQAQNQVLERLFALLNGLKWGAWAIAAVTLASTVLLLWTTIRLTAFTRRRETRIMRLVGASNMVIQMPFVLEGMIAAAVGSALASVALFFAVQVGIQGWLQDRVSFISTYVSGVDALLVVPWLFLVGLLIAGVSSFVSLQRYLKV
ncbi:MAG: permease-like cell division protein FtsX [Actinomycetota bacterium]|nr:permease-like cell division protein FtsX [Actinomycetota bacterium]